MGFHAAAKQERWISVFHVSVHSHIYQTNCIFKFYMKDTSCMSEAGYSSPLSMHTDKHTDR